MNKKKEVFIVGGGYSLKNFDFKQLKDKNTIVINKALFHVPNANYFITMDFSFLFNQITSIQKEIISKNNINKFFIANLVPEYMKDENGMIRDSRFDLIYDLKDFDVIIKSRQLEGIGLDWKYFKHGNNSGYCALQLAVLLGYTEINLLGIDMIIGNQTHFHEGYNRSVEQFKRNLDIYYPNFVKGINELKEKRPDIKIYSCSKISRLNNILEYKEI